MFVGGGSGVLVGGGSGVSVGGSDVEVGRSVSVGNGVRVRVGTGVLVAVVVGIRLAVTVEEGIRVFVAEGTRVFVDVDVDIGGPPPSLARVCVWKTGKGKEVSEAVAVFDTAIVEVIVIEAVGEGLESALFAKEKMGGPVGVTKRATNAALVSALSKGVAVGVNLGWRTMSSCVSCLPPAIMYGMPKARIHTKRKVNGIMKPCCFLVSIVF